MSNLALDEDGFEVIEIRRGSVEPRVVKELKFKKIVFSEVGNEKIKEYRLIRFERDGVVYSGIELKKKRDFALVTSIPRESESVMWSSYWNSLCSLQVIDKEFCERAKEQYKDYVELTPFVEKKEQALKTDSEKIDFLRNWLFEKDGGCSEKSQWSVEDLRKALGKLC